MEPITREEQFLAKAAGDNVNIPEPITREEVYLKRIAENGGGGGGTSNYEQLSNKPQINGVTLSGNKSADDLNLASKADVTGKADKVSNATSGHLAGLDSNGNLTDSGVSPTEDVTVEGNPVTFESPFEQDAKSVVVTAKPIQDLHGYDYPWVGGAGKNKLPLVLADIKAANTDGTWSGNTYSIYGVDFTVNVDDADNVLSIKANGTAINNAYFDFIPTFNSTAYTGMIFNGLSSQTEATVRISGSNRVEIQRLINESAVIDNGDNLKIAIRVGINSTITNELFYPMLRLATESDATFAPYSNICPISGIDELEIGVSDGESEPTTTTIPLPSTLYDADVDVTEGSADSRVGIIDLGTLTWNYDSSVEFFVADLPLEIRSIIKNNSPLICEAFEDAEIRTVDYIKNHVGSILTNATYNLWCNTGSATVTPTGKAVYKLATPTTLSLTPVILELLEGTNVLTTNGEKVAVTFGRSLWQDIDDLKTDTKGKLDKSDVADVEGDTASRAYSVNEFMLRADGLYKVTQPIAQNASITASNTTKTTIGAVLTALLNA